MDYITASRVQAIVLNIRTRDTVRYTANHKMRIRNLFQLIRVVCLRAVAQQSIRKLGGERFRREGWRHFPRNKFNWVCFNADIHLYLYTLP